MENTIDIVGTAKSAQLCRQIAEISDGVCVLGFSRGKDSVCAWLWLRKFFKKIYPFTVVTVPHLDFVDRSLAYYEDYFGTKIDRFLDENTIDGFKSLTYQTPDRVQEIDAMQFTIYTKNELCNLMREKYNCPKAWNAFGISAGDSIQRRSRVLGCQGRVERAKTFYPCFDWSKKKIVSTLQSVGIKLSPDYRISNRSVAGIPNVRDFEKLESEFPEDYERTLVMFSYAEVCLARNYFRKKHFGKL